MIKHNSLQKFIYKIHSTRLRKSYWDLTLSIADAMRNAEIIALADSTMLRFIDELNQIDNAEESAYEIKSKIRKLKRGVEANRRKKEIARLYEELNAIQFKPDYLCLIMDSNADYKFAYQHGFKINGIKYCRLLATTGGVKGSTIVFTSERLYPELHQRIQNGRNPSVPLVPAKFGAYEALTCSSSTVVSDPLGILVVPDCEVDFFEDVIQIDDSDSEEPKMTFCKNAPLHKVVSDGFGLMTPQRSRIWAEESGLDYLPSGICCRPYAFGKGMLVTFDFHRFAEEIAHSNMVQDAWGHPVDINTVDVILTTSMLKLWDSYSSIEDYMCNCKKNHYHFCITKICPPSLENERNLNYQFLQSYRLTDEQIETLIRPTIEELHDILGDDYRKSLLFLRGLHITEENVLMQEQDYIKALLIDPRMAEDLYVRSCIHRMIQKRITEAKIGVIKVSGNFQIACGDPYALCQSIFQLPVTGLLKAGEFYSRYWSDKKVQEAACFRAPMTCHNNIRKLYFPNTKEQEDWYSYIKTMLIFNSWDTSADALNGEDWDGDQNLTTDNPVLLDNLRELPTIMCIQRKADKKIVTKEDLVKANIDSFGDDIGLYTNGITSQFDVQAQFPCDSPEYKTLEYRIMCGQLFQQNAIDKAKGILAKPRPFSWFGYSVQEDEDKNEFYQRIIADKKPYFMKYIYPQTMRSYKDYEAKSNLKCLTTFQITLDELKEKHEKSEAEATFLYYYHKRMPVGNHDCITNKICRRFEQEFDGYISRFNKNEFDYRLLKSEASYSTASFKSIKALYLAYTSLLSRYKQRISRERIDEETALDEKASMLQIFYQDCSTACPNRRQLANIVLDLCYTANNSKQFAWDMCRDVFIETLLEKNHNTVSYPIEHPDGDILYRGITFRMEKIQIGEMKE